MCRPVVARYAAIIATLDSAPVLIGHSFGGMIAEKLLGQGRGAGAVAIDRGHSLTIDHGWREIADTALSWLGENGLGRGEGNGGAAGDEVRARSTNGRTFSGVQVSGADPSGTATGRGPTRAGAHG